MEDFVKILQRDYGLQPGGKRAPMAGSHSRVGSSGMGQRSGSASKAADDDMFNGFVNSPPFNGSADKSILSQTNPSQTYHSRGMDVNCCQHQHEVLVTFIRYALQCLGPLDDFFVSYWINGTIPPWKQASAIPVTPELKRVLTRARILSEDCCTESPPLQAVLRHADRSEAFADIVKEIQWCISVVYNGNICSNMTRRSAPELKGFPWQAQIGYHEKLLLEKAEEEDFQHQMLMLENHDGHHHCSAEYCGNMLGRMDLQYCLRAQVFGRQSREDLRMNKPDHKSLLWSFNPEVVKYGRPLGSGSFGAVTEVTWLGFKYAQKIFNAAGLHSLPAEAEALVKLNHPHIVKVYAYSEDSLLMDLMSTDLHKFMKNRMKGGARIRPFSLPAAIDSMLQIADAVSYLHSQNVAHRDLKSSNILVNPVSIPGLDEDDGFLFAKIADFGLAKVKRDITRYSHLTRNVGTRRWMAPEIFGANIEDDHLEHAFPIKADVYSFGIVCFEILTGEEPFIDEPLTTLYSKLTAPIPLRRQLPSSCPTYLASLICECWDADPRKRPAFGDVCRVLRYLKGLPTLIALSNPPHVPIDGEWPFGRLTSMIKILQKQGPWRASGKPQDDWRVRTVGLFKGVDIRAVQFLFNDPGERQLSGLRINSHYGVQLGNSTTSGQNSICIGKGRGNWICFEPNEFLVQVEGSISPTLGIKSLSFITTRQKYGPYGTFSGETIPFCSDPGKVVGMTAFVDRLDNLVSLEVHTIPNIIGCLQRYLGSYEESIA